MSFQYLYIAGRYVFWYLMWIYVIYFTNE